MSALSLFIQQGSCNLPGWCYLFAVLFRGSASFLLSYCFVYDLTFFFSPFKLWPTTLFSFTLCQLFVHVFISVVWTQNRLVPQTESIRFSSLNNHYSGFFFALKKRLVEGFHFISAHRIPALWRCRIKRKKNPVCSHLFYNAFGKLKYCWKTF